MAICILGISLSTWARTPKRYLMGVIGDSISVGFLADIPLENPENDFDQELAPELWLDNRDSLSWASGNEIQSHFKRLNSYLTAIEDKEFELTALNVAASGRKISDMPRQAEILRREMASGKYDEIQYVTVWMGSNDACSTRTPEGTPDDEMSYFLMKALGRLAAIPQSNIRVLVVGLPRIPDLGFSHIRDYPTIFNLSCTFVRDVILNSCSPMLSWQTEEEYRRLTTVIQRKNTMIADTVRAAGKFHRNLDLTFTPYLENQPISSPQLLATDCFHPSKLGQERIAEGLWMEQPWFK